jgi:small redox-active disulfide protein 2
MRIEILGMQCPECDQTVQNVRQAVAELGLAAEVKKIEDPEAIASYGLLFPPVLLIDGEVKVAGRVPKLKQLKQWLAAT